MLRRRVLAAALFLVGAAAALAADEKKEEVLKLPAAEVKAVRNGGDVEEAKKKWNGKTAEFTVKRWSSHQDQTTGDHKGQTLFSFDLDYAETGKRTGNTIPVYVKDKKDITFLKDLKIRNDKPVTIRGTVMVDKTGWRMWMEDARVVRTAQEREAEDKDAKAPLKAVRTQKKTKDKKAVVLTAQAAKAMHGHDKMVETLAKKNWNGKLVEVTAVSWSSHQDQKTGDHAGETLFSFDLDEAATGKKTGNILAVYFKDADDIATLKARKISDKTPFKVRGKLVADPKVVWRIWLVDARLVKE